MLFRSVAEAARKLAEKEAAKKEAAKKEAAKKEAAKLAVQDRETTEFASAGPADRFISAPKAGGSNLRTITIRLK